MTRSKRHGPAPLAITLWVASSPVTHVAAMVVCGAVVVWAPDPARWAILIPLVIALAWMNHLALTRLHEAAHGGLSRSKVLNEIHGVVIGTLAFTPLSVYRYVHARHHAHLGSERDPEFWPYSMPGTPRAIRVGYAWVELLFGWIVTPWLYSIRTAMSWSSVPRRQHARLVMEWCLLVVVWVGIVWLVTARGWWPIVLFAFVIPAWLTGMAQTARKFIEHLGMHGDTIESMTRTVVYQGRLGRLASASQMHVDHHGTHHRHANIPYYALPSYTADVCGEEQLFSSHLGAILDTVPHLLDPRIGPQWNTVADAR